MNKELYEKYADKLLSAMKREIKFRGMSLIVGFCEWRYGFFSTYPKGAHITTPDGECWPVAIESVGQFTGLKDKNGKEVYEGDVLRIEYVKIAVGENLGVYETEAELTGVVGFDGLSLILQNIVGEKWQEYTGYDAGEGNCKFMYLGDVYEGSLDASYQIEVIGNIYENPELIESKS